jgi:hypothetical protein
MLLQRLSDTLEARASNAERLGDTMSESSSVTSSQLDDIELAAPQSKTFEHHTDVGYMFGEEKPQWSLPVMPARESPAAHSSSTKVDEYGTSSTFAMERAPAEVTARPEHVESRFERDSGATPDECQGRPRPRHRFSDARSEASVDANVRVSEASSSYTVTVDVLSTAFTLTEQAWQQGYQLGRSPADVICQRACTGLGVDKGSLRYFELAEVPASQLRPSGRYAVAIDRSGAHLDAALCLNNLCLCCA